MKNKQKAHNLLIKVGITPDLKAYDILYYLLLNQKSEKNIFAQIYDEFGINYDKTTRHLRYVIETIKPKVKKALVGNTKLTPLKLVKTLQKVFALGIKLEVEDESNNS